MNISILPFSRLYRFPSVCLLVIFCLGCSTTPKSMFEMDGEPLDSGITLEPEQRINIYTKDKRIVSMDGHEIKAKNIEGKLLVVDSGSVDGNFAVFAMEEVKSITVGEVERSKPSSLTNAAYFAGGTLCFVTFIYHWSDCDLSDSYNRNKNKNRNKVEWVTQYDKVEDDYKIAFTWYQQAADQGDPIAMVNLGSMYAAGQGVSQDYKAAIDWYELAAEQSIPIAMANLGDMYAEGLGVAKDKKTAFEWYELAIAHGIAETQLGLELLHIKAEQGDAQAQNNLGEMYEKGQDVSQDYEAAFKWYKLAAEQGHAQAQTNLGWMYETGRGVTQDYEAALKWYKLAAEQGHANAQDYKAAIELQVEGILADN